MTDSGNKRIAKNTMMLYFRMLLILAVTLYTSRVVLRTLGVDDYGLNNIVAGVLSLLSVISTSMNAATSRFLTFELGKKDFPQLKKVFNTALSLYIVMALIILLIAETVGLWFVRYKLVIPEARMSAALWAYQFSILSTMVTLTQVPYNALVISHEKMNIFAYISILQTVLKLVIVYMLTLSSFDKLKFYSMLQFFVILLVTLVYRCYCNRKFPESTISFKWDKALYKQMLSFSIWDLYTVFTGVAATQGLNIMLNMFFGVSVNAARGLAISVKGNISNFGDNFMTAVRPQIIKLYAENKIDQMMKLVFESSKLSFFLTYFIALPVLMETQTIFNVWLDIVPAHTVLFCRLMLIENLIASFRMPIVTSFHAVGKIKLRNSVCGSLYLLNVVVSFICLKLGYPSESVFVVAIAVTVLVQWAELFLLKTVMKFSVFDYFVKVILPAMAVMFISAAVPYSLTVILEPGLFRFLIVGFSCVMALSISAYYIGVDAETRQKVKQMIISKLHQMKLKRVK